MFTIVFTFIDLPRHAWILSIVESVYCSSTYLEHFDSEGQQNHCFFLICNQSIMVNAADKALTDATIRQYEDWKYACQQMRTEDMVKFVNVPDCEEGYPLFKSELPPGEQLVQHAIHPPPKPKPETRVTLAFGNFMYSKLVSTSVSPILVFV